MVSAILVAGVLTVVFAIAVAIDRGVPNALESCACRLEGLAADVVTALRRAAAKLRARHVAIERANRRRINGYSDTTVIRTRDAA